MRIGIIKKYDNVKVNRPVGENIIKAELILNAFQNYRRQSKFFRLLEWFGLR